MHFLESSSVTLSKGDEAYGILKWLKNIRKKFYQFQGKKLENIICYNICQAVIHNYRFLRKEKKRNYTELLIANPILGFQLNNHSSV